MSLSLAQIASVTLSTHDAAAVIAIRAKRAAPAAMQPQQALKKWPCKLTLASLEIKSAPVGPKLAYMYAMNSQTFN